MKIDYSGYIASAYLLLTPKTDMEKVSLIMSIVAPIVIVVYHMSKMYIDVIRPNYGGSWKKYFKSIPRYLIKGPKKDANQTPRDEAE